MWVERLKDELISWRFAYGTKLIFQWLHWSQHNCCFGCPTVLQFLWACGRFRGWGSKLEHDRHLAILHVRFEGRAFWWVWFFPLTGGDLFTMAKAGISSHSTFFLEGEPLETLIATIQNPPWNEQHMKTTENRGAFGLPAKGSKRIIFQPTKSTKKMVANDMVVSWGWSPTLNPIQ